MSEETGYSQVPGQVTLPGMAEEMGYEAIMLKPINERFCWEYVLRQDNGCRAYMAVFGETDEEKARKNASKLSKKDDIMRRIAEIKVELKRKYSVTADDLVQYHARVLKIDRREYLGADGRPKLIADIDSEAASILEFDCDRDAKSDKIHTMLRVPQRHQSAVELAKMMGLHKESLDLSGKVAMEHSGVVGVTEDAEKLDALRSKFKGMASGAAGSPA